MAGAEVWSKSSRPSHYHFGQHPSGATHPIYNAVPCALTLGMSLACCVWRPDTASERHAQGECAWHGIINGMCCSTWMLTEVIVAGAAGFRPDLCPSHHWSSSQSEMKTQFRRKS